MCDIKHELFSSNTYKYKCYRAIIIKHWRVVRCLFLSLSFPPLCTALLLKFRKLLYMFVFVIAGHGASSLCPRRIQGFLYSWVQETQLSVSSFPFSLPLSLSVLRLVHALKSVVPFPTLGQLVWAYSSGDEGILYCSTGLTTYAWWGWYFPSVGMLSTCYPATCLRSSSGSWDRALAGGGLLLNDLFSLLLSPGETLGKGVATGRL